METATATATADELYKKKARKRRNTHPLACFEYFGTLATAPTTTTK